MSRWFQWQPSRVFNFLRLHRMCPRVAKAETSGEFFGGDFRGCFNNRSERIALFAGVFAVRVVNAPKLIFPLRGQNWCRVHTAIEHDAASRQVRIAHFLLRRMLAHLLRWKPWIPNARRFHLECRKTFRSGDVKNLEGFCERRRIKGQEDNPASSSESPQQESKYEDLKINYSHGRCCNDWLNPDSECCTTGSRATTCGR